MLRLMVVVFYFIYGFALMLLAFTTTDFFTFILPFVLLPLSFVSITTAVGLSVSKKWACISSSVTTLLTFFLWLYFLFCLWRASNYSVPNLIHILPLLIVSFMFVLVKIGFNFYIIGYTKQLQNEKT